MTPRPPLALSCLAVLTALGAGCAAGPESAAAGPGPAAAPPARRTRPTQRAMARALDRVAADAAGCLRPTDRALTVTGEFDGPTGAFRAASVAGTDGAPLPPAVEACVVRAVGAARVRPFTRSRADHTHRFALAGDGAAAAPAEVAAGADGADAGRSALTLPPGPPGASGGAPLATTPMPAALIRREDDAFRQCYEQQALSRDPNVEGTVTVRLVLDAGGRIVRLSTRAESSHPDHTLMELVAGCVEQRVRAIAFGPQPHADGTEIVVPLAFHAGGVPADAGAASPRY